MAKNDDLASVVERIEGAVNTCLKNTDDQHGLQDNDTSLLLGLRQSIRRNLSQDSEDDGVLGRALKMLGSPRTPRTPTPVKSRNSTPPSSPFPSVVGAHESQAAQNGHVNVQLMRHESSEGEPNAELRLVLEGGVEGDPGDDGRGSGQIDNPLAMQQSRAGEGEAADMAELVDDL